MKRLQRISGRIAGIGLFFFLLAACATTPGKPAEVEEEALTIKMENFRFEPDTVRARKGESMTLRLVNTAGFGHNMTILTPSGQRLVSIDVPARESASLKITLSEAGTYPFYCNRTFHSFLGMNGRIEAAP